jgi:lysozyme
MDNVNLKVVDLSHHNVGPRGGSDDIDFEAMFAGGIRGVILKSSQGAANVDRTYEDRRQAARDAGLLVGAYHFAESGDVDTEVKNFLNAAQPDAKTLMALDHEAYQGDNNLDLDGARAFLESLRDQLGGRLPFLYSGNLIKEQLGRCDDDATRDFFGQFPFWLCQYGPRMVMVDSAGNDLPWSKPTLWQFSGDGTGNRGLSVAGVYHGNTVDMSSFDGSDEELAKVWA